MVEVLAKENGVFFWKNKISNRWWRRFIERQPELSLCHAHSTAHIQMDSINKESVTEYFDLLDSTLKENHLEDGPDQIYNMDEIGMPLDTRPPNINNKVWPNKG